VSLNLLFLAGAAVSGTVLAVLAVVYHRMRKTKKPSLIGFEKPPKTEGITLPEVSQVTRELQSDHVSILAEPETKKTFLAIMTKLVQEKKE
jgi:hypothetical protein